MATLTAANSVLMIGFASIFPTAQQIQGYDVDDAFAIGRVSSAQTKMGVDGKLSGGWMPVEKRMSIFLQGDSASCDIFDTVVAQQDAARESFLAFGILLVPALSKSYALTKGFLSTHSVFADAKKVLQRREFEITWESVIGSPTP